MARTAIQPVDMADPRPRYTHGWRVGNTVYVAGQLALDNGSRDNVSCIVIEVTN